jgi:hypothetical protein
MPHLMISDAKAGEADRFAQALGWCGKALAAASVRRDHECVVNLP